MSESKDEGRSIPGVITTAITVAGFAFLYLSQAPQLPVLERVLFGGIVAVSILLFIVWIWSRPFRAWYEAWKKNRMARRNYPQLIRFSERLAEFLEPNRTTNPHRILMALRGQGFGSLVMPESSYAQLISWDLEKGLKLARPNLKSLIWGADFMDSVIRFYTEQYLVKPVAQVHSVLKSTVNTSSEKPPELPEPWRDEYNAARESFVGFLGEYEEFTSRLNRELGKVRRMVGDTLAELEVLRGSHFERPKEL